MKKKRPVVPFSKTKALAQADDRTWHNGGDQQIGFYARSLHRAAKDIIATLDLQPNSRTVWDACPVILLYREAVELYMKLLVGEGSGFLQSPTDPITLYKTHSLRWLAQIVCQIIRALKWESDFKCDGVASLGDFNALINDLEARDPVSNAVFGGGRNASALLQVQPLHVVQFARKLDALIDLLDKTADALAAAWDQLVSEESAMGTRAYLKPTIQ